MKTGKLTSFQEVEGDCVGETAKNSLSLARAPGASTDGLKGSSTNYPFMPGGFHEQSLCAEDQNASLNVENEEDLFDPTSKFLPPLHLSLRHSIPYSIQPITILCIAIHGICGTFLPMFIQNFCGNFLEDYTEYNMIHRWILDLMIR